MAEPVDAIRFLLRCAFVGLLSAGMLAQVGPLNPTSSINIQMPLGGLHYSSVNIPAGVVVNFWAPGGPFRPALIRCDGDFMIEGVVSVSGELLRGIGWSPGLVTVGNGNDGSTCNYQMPFLSWPSGGRHAGLYGSAIPFDLRGGSFGGDLVVFDYNCWTFLYRRWGGVPGGTIAVHAGGRIDIRGVVTADGESAWGQYYAGGSGGSILLRADQGLTIHPGASVSAIGLDYPGSLVPQGLGRGGPGIIRIDSWASPPVILGTIDPPATVLTLPHLHVPSPPQLGIPWRLDVLAPEGAPTFVAVSLVPTAGTQTPFGILSIDLTLAAVLGVAIPQPSHDPMASVTMPIPNMPAFLALPLAAQALVVPQTLAPRLTNAVTTAIQ
jgi:hypothetical protein